MSQGRKLSLDDVLKIQEKEAQKPARSTSRARQLDLNEAANRNVLVWLKLPHSLGYCENPDCPDDRPRKVAEGNAMTTVVDGTKMCRFCFIEGFGL